MRLPPPTRRCSPISVMALTPDTVSRPNSRSIAARSSRSSSKISLPVMVAGADKEEVSVCPVIGELHVNAEIAAFDERDDLLQRVAVLSTHAHQVSLNGSLHFFLGILD